MTKMNRNVKNLLGQRFNKLLVEEFKGVNAQRSALWLCLCDCGDRVTIDSHTLQRGSQTCGGPVCRHSMHQNYPKYGDRFGMLTAIDFCHTNKKGGGLYWKFRCDCGKEVSTRWFQVKNKKIDHCGCQSVRKSVLAINVVKGTVREDIHLNHLILNYRKNAAVRNLEFKLTGAQFRRLVTSNCFFCDSAPINKLTSRKRKILTDEPTFEHNGIDRWHSHRGYTVENCVPCCKTCNYAKRSMSGEDFIKWIERAVIYVTKLSATWQTNKKAVEEELLQL